MSSTYNIADRCFSSFVTGQMNFAPCPFLPWAPSMQMLMTAHPASDAPFPWHIPCVLMLIPPPVKLVESPNPVLRKNFIFSIVLSMDSTAVIGTPKA